jgi:sirohydrochlorin cobaltochelatase
MKQGILVVAFGTLERDGARNLGKVERIAQEVFPGASVRWAFTSRFIHNSLEKRGRAVDSPGRAFKRLLADGCSSILVWPLFVSSGKEFAGLRAELASLRHSMTEQVRVTLGMVLLEACPDKQWIASALAGLLPRQTALGEAVVLVGHGRKGEPIDPGYGEVLRHLQRLGQHCYFGALEGSTSLDALLPMLIRDHVEKVLLLPFLVLAGRHVREDLAGPGPGSWRSILAAHGISCEVVQRCLTDSVDLLTGWIEHLRAVAGASG